jgi:hypothetical protein
MADRQIQQIRSIYGEILGIADHLAPNLVPASSIVLYNGAIDELSSISASDYSRFKATSADAYSQTDYYVSAVKPKMGSLLARLEQEFGFYKPERGAPQPTTNIVTIHNNNQLSVTVIPIQEVLQTITDDEGLRADVEALKAVIEGNKDKKRASSLLSSIQQKSWEVFIALLPVVLEHLGRSQGN